MNQVEIISLEQNNKLLKKQLEELRKNKKKLEIILRQIKSAKFYAFWQNIKIKKSNKK